MSGSMHRRILGIVILILGLLGSLFLAGSPALAAGPQPMSLTPSWGKLGAGITGWPGGVTTVAVGPDGSVYAAGRFDSVDGTVPARNIARWDGTAWHPMGSGITNPIFELTDINALAIGADGSLYVGGSFTAAGGLTAYNVARWDGTAWHPMGGGIGDGPNSPNGPVFALAVGPDGSVYAGGDFDQVEGNLPAKDLARWDGTAWHPMGTDLDGVSALAFNHKGLLYAATSDRIARLSGTTWQTIGTFTGGEGANSLVFAGDGSLYSAGYFHTISGVPAESIARWNGTWQALGSGLDSQAYALAASPTGGVYAGGNFQSAGGIVVHGIALWTGTTWQALAGGADSDVYGLATAPDGNLYAGGSFVNMNGAKVNHIARWGTVGKAGEPK